MLLKNEESSLNKGLGNYDDIGFSLFLRKSFIKEAGDTDEAPFRPAVSIGRTETTQSLPRRRG